MKKFAFVIVCYNRPNSLRRLLDSLNKIVLPKENITLYISVDNAKTYDENNEHVKIIAEQFKWKYGDKIVDIKKCNLGLKQHVFECGNLTNRFDNVIVLEDDLVVSPLIYEYAKSVTDFYKEDERIAGFGLYTYPKNQYSNKLFVPLNDGTDVFFMQNPCSWGQIWNKKQWSDFYNWYLNNCNYSFYSKNIPKKVCLWDDKSWLKWHIKYVIEKNLYFVYPYISLTTNFSEKGVHNSKDSFEYQSSLCYKTNKIKFSFSNFDLSRSVYDAYYENIRLNTFCEINQLICSDYNNLKNIIDIKEHYNYLLSTKKYNYHIIKKYGLEMYPYEQNIINNIDGDALYLYDLTVVEKNKNINNKINEILYSYRLNYFSFKELLLILKWVIFEIIIRIMYRIKHCFGGKK